MIFSVLIQDLEPVRSWPPHSNKRMRTHVVEANDFGQFFFPGVEDPVSNTDCLPAILCIENLSRAGRVRKNSKCWQCRQPRLNHIYQSHVESYTYTVLLCQLCLTIWSLSPLRNYKCIQLCSWVEFVPVQLRGMAQCTAFAGIPKDVPWSTRCLVNNTTPQAFHRTSFFTFKSPWRAVASGLCNVLRNRETAGSIESYVFKGFQSSHFNPSSMLISHMQQFCHCMNCMNIWTSCHPSKLSTVPMVSRAWCTRSPTRERASITPWRKTTGNLGKFTQILRDFIRARLAQAKVLALGRALVLVAICCLRAHASQPICRSWNQSNLVEGFNSWRSRGKKLRFR